MRLSLFSALSLVLHLALVWLLLFWRPQDQGSWSQQGRTVDVVYVDPQNKNSNPDKTFVRKVEVPESYKFEDPKAEARFSSEDRQRVIQETRAQETGLTKNRQSGPKFLEDELRELRNRQKKQAEREKSDQGESFKVFDPKQELQNLGGGPSTISVKLPDSIAVGSFTALNTDRNIYYTFYARLEDMIYLRWANLIRKAVESYPVDFRRRKLLGRSWTTNVLILLKPNGEFYQAQIHLPSGIEKFDLSPALAFQDARMFPNPPPEMVRSDGYIHVSYSFVVDFGQVQ
jgi:hypothetical protein